MDFKKNIGFGCVSLTMHTFEREALKMLETAYDLGIRHFDTAPLYGQGYSERILGNFLKRKRSDVTITTKFGLSSTDPKSIPVWMALPLNSFKKAISKKQLTTTGREEQIEVKISFREISLEEVKKSFNNSLRNLKTDYIDYYLLHEALPDFLTEESIHYIKSLKMKGLIKKIGIATSAFNQRYLIESDMVDWDILQYENIFNSPAISLQEIFPGKLHYHHSIFKPLNQMKIDPVNRSRKAAALLALDIKNNITGKTLFATTQMKHLVSNMSLLEEFITYEESDLTEIITECHF